MYPRANEGGRDKGSGWLDYHTIVIYVKPCRWQAAQAPGDEVWSEVMIESHLNRQPLFVSSRNTGPIRAAERRASQSRQGRNRGSYRVRKYRVWDGLARQTSADRVSRGLLAHVHGTSPVRLLVYSSLLQGFLKLFTVPPKLWTPHLLAACVSASCRCVCKFHPELYTSWPN